jgi:hypothetical protein
MATPYWREYAMRVARTTPDGLSFLATPHPCDNGHHWVNVNGYLTCSRCKTVLGKA